MKLKLFFTLLPLGLLSLTPPALAATDARVDVILWFDTEDYLSPADDDACKRLADMLTERHIRATFKIVAEKARVLERRGRWDVIAALKKHDIGFHSNLHSVHPTPSEYLADCGLLDGAAEFIRREGGGADDVRRIFSVKTLACYGQPGSSWAPQPFTVLKQLGIAPHGVACYVDEDAHVGLGQKPFWYAGALTVFNLGENCTRMELFQPAAVEPAKRKVSAVAERLRSLDGGGLISIYYHPCEWIQLQFWDGVNFSRGANPPRELWKPPGQRSAEETDAAFLRFGEYIDHIRRIPGVRFVTASELPEIYPDLLLSQGAPEEDFAQITARLASEPLQGVDFQVLGVRAYSVAEQFELLVRALGNLIEEKPLQFPVPINGLLGPDSIPPSRSQVGRLTWPAFREATRDALDFVATQRRVPSRVFIGAEAVAPADFLVGMSRACQFYRKNGRLPTQEGVTMGEGTELLPARHVASDTPELFGRWPIHKEGFRAPKILEQARLQAWTLKPAVRSN